MSHTHHHHRLDYIAWTQQTYLTASNSTKSHFVSLLEACTHTFQSNPQYQSDLRYLKVWLLYADCCRDAQEVFAFLKTNKIGRWFFLLFFRGSMFAVCCLCRVLCAASSCAVWERFVTFDLLFVWCCKHRVGARSAVHHMGSGGRERRQTCVCRGNSDVCCAQTHGSAHLCPAISAEWVAGACGGSEASHSQKRVGGWFGAERCSAHRNRSQQRNEPQTALSHL